MGAIVAMRHSVQLTKVESDEERLGQKSCALPETANRAVDDTSKGSIDVLDTAVDRNTLPSTSDERTKLSDSKEATHLPVRDQAKKLVRSNSGQRSTKDSSKASMKTIEIANAVEDTRSERRFKPAQRSEESIHDRYKDKIARSQQADTIISTWRNIIFMPEFIQAFDEPGYNIRWRTSIFQLQEQEFQKKLRALNRWTRKDYISRYTELTLIERRIIERYLDDNKYLDLRGMGFKKIPSPKEFDHRLRWRCVYVLVESQLPIRGSVADNFPRAQTYQHPGPAYFHRQMDSIIRVEDFEPRSSYRPTAIEHLEELPGVGARRNFHDTARPVELKRERDQLLLVRRPKRERYNEHRLESMESSAGASEPEEEEEDVAGAVTEAPSEDSEQPPPRLSPESQQIIDELLEKFTTVDVGNTRPYIYT